MFIFITMLGVLVFVVPVVCILVFLIYITYQRYKYSHLPTPKYKHFFLGHMDLIQQKVASGGHVSELLEEWMREYGLLFVFFILHRSIVITLKPSAVKEIFLNPIHTKNTQFYQRFHTLFGERMVGYGLFNEHDHEKWTNRRRLLNPAFKKGYLIGLMPKYNSSVDELIDLLKPSADGQTEVKMAEMFSKVALDIIAKVAFDLKDLDIISNHSSKFNEAAKMAFFGITYCMRYPYLSNIDPRRKYRDIRKAVQEALRLLRNTGRMSIIGRMEAMRRGEDVPQDILTYILTASNNLEGSQEFGLEEMVDEFVTFFVAGQETSSNLMAFTLELLGRNPEEYKRLQDEVDSVVGEKQFLSYEDINKLDYMSLVFKEVLRLLPPAPGSQRRSGCDLVINGYKIPAGSNIGCSHFAMCRSELYFDDPEEFKPERFKEEDPRRLYAYFPFALGPRSCIGQQFALIESKVIMARLLRTFRFDLVPGYPLQCTSEVTLKPTHGTRCFLHLRN